MLSVLGLMSGTSMDGIDIAHIKTDGQNYIEFGIAETIPFPSDFRARLKAFTDLLNSTELHSLESDFTQLTIKYVDEFIKKHRLDIDLIGFHGQTLYHNPLNQETLQIGNGELLSSKLNINVVYDFRSADIKEGGEGAPIVPIFHQTVFQEKERPLVVLNIGGVANITWIGKDNNDLIAFDTGPGNALLDDWVLQNTKSHFDVQGRLAQSGQVDYDLVKSFLTHNYFLKPPPKSLDRNDFKVKLDHLSIEDGAATLVEITVQSIVASNKFLPEEPVCWVITGGGRHNDFLLKRLGKELQKPVLPIEDVGFDGDALEAQAMGYLAVRTFKNLPITFPKTTGVPHPLCGGQFIKAS